MNGIVTVTLNPAFDVTLTLPSALSADAVNRVKSEQVEAAGTGVNIALTLNLLGTDVLAVGLCGEKDTLSFSSALSGRGLKNEFISVPGAVRENLTVLAGGETYKINRSGFEADNSSLEALLALLGGIRAKYSVAVIGGSLPRGISPARLCEFAKALAALGFRLVLDTDTLSREQLISIAPWLIKPNLFELELLFGRSLSSQDEQLSACRELIASGVGSVLLSLGGDGLLAVSETEAVRVTGTPVAPINTVGAGDSTLAGFLHAVMSGDDLSSAASFAAACGTAAVLTPHAVISDISGIKHVPSNRVFSIK